MTEPLEPGHLALLSEVARLHSGFILGFEEAITLTDRADRMRFSATVEEDIRQLSASILGVASEGGKLFSSRAKMLIESVTAALHRSSWEISRIGFTGYATTRNLLIAIGRIALWINDKGGSLAGGIIAAPIIGVNPAEQIRNFATIIISQAEQITALATAFPELRDWVSWLIDFYSKLYDKEKK